MTESSDVIRHPFAARELGISVHELDRRIDAAGIEIRVVDGRRAILRRDLETLVATPDPARRARS